MDEVAFQSKMAGSLCQAWIAQEAPSAGSPEEPDEAQAVGEASVSGCFPGLPGHLDYTGPSGVLARGWDRHLLPSRSQP